MRIGIEWIAGKRFAKGIHGRACLLHIDIRIANVVMQGGIVHAGRAGGLIMIHRLFGSVHNPQANAEIVVCLRVVRVKLECLFEVRDCAFEVVLGTTQTAHGHVRFRVIGVDFSGLLEILHRLVEATQLLIAKPQVSYGLYIFGQETDRFLVAGNGLFLAATSRQGIAQIVCDLRLVREKPE